MKTPNRKTVSRLQDLPNIGEKMAHDLQIIGIQHPDQLTGKNGYQLYDDLCQITGKSHDPCVIDVFLSVVDFMNGGQAKPWWKYTEERKQHLRAQR
jgi:hypothetical protein